jgi:hypothetical protein
MTTEMARSGGLDAQTVTDEARRLALKSVE